jgi:hypothetical protein
MSIPKGARTFCVPMIRSCQLWHSSEQPSISSVSAADIMFRSNHAEEQHGFVTQVNMISMIAAQRRIGYDPPRYDQPDWQPWSKPVLVCVALEIAAEDP